MLLPLWFAVIAMPADALPVESAVRAVSIHPHSALITRRALLPDGDGRYVVHGLPATLDPESVRLRLDGAEANAVEVRAAIGTAIPGARLAELDARIAERRRDLSAATDTGQLSTSLRTRLEALLEQEAAAHAGEVARGAEAAATWSTNYEWLAEQLLAARPAERLAAFAVEDAVAALAAAESERGIATKGEARRGFDVAFTAVALTRGSHECEIEYEVAGARWGPRYDLRADAKLSEVALTYRAEVSQQTGEDWRDVEVWLSTAEPRRGVVGPTAPTVWLDLASSASEDGRIWKVAHLGYAEKSGRLFDSETGDEPTQATVEHEGLSVRYKLPRVETIESRPGSTTVLLGHATLAVTGERVATPALDRDVWIRARAINSSDWVMLPGPAAVFFGSDYVGPATVTLVRPGEEFTLHLGRDPGLIVTRVHVEDRAGSAGLFGSKKEQLDRYTIKLKNQAALSSAADGSVTVQVREVIETAHDDRIDVELEFAKPPVTKSERFDRERKEKGILTWEVVVTPGGEATIDWTRKITWPEDCELENAGGRIGVGQPSSGRVLALLAAALTLLAAAITGATLITRRLRRRVTPAFATAVAVVVVAAIGIGARDAAAQTTVESRLARVTVYGDGALIERTATLPGSGTFVLRDLPQQADPSSIRVRIDGGEIVSVETRERRERHLPDAALDALRERLRTTLREQLALEDERAALDALAQHLGTLLAPTTDPSAVPQTGRPDAAAWAAEGKFLAQRVATNQAARRDSERRLEAKREELAALQRQITGGEATDLIVRDVEVDAVGSAEGRLACTVSYLVRDAGWAPEYELRAARDLRSVDLTYRARVWQQTAEPWRDVLLTLSTAAPQRGAAGPAPSPRGLSLREPVSSGFAVFGSRAEAAAPGATAGLVPAELAADPATADAAIPVRAAPFATVANEGISERFALPDPQTIEPGGESQRVLVGRASLPLTLERWCVPAVDPTVWLRGKAKNDSPWTLLPGRTAVHMGNDYLGRGTLALTHKGADAELYLGPDPWIAVERTELADHLSTSSFSANGTRKFAWRIALMNLGAPAAAADGSVEVIVQESLPRARDERIEVKLDNVKPRQSEREDDRKARDESSLLTWRVAVARGTTGTTLEWGYSVAHPAELELITTQER